MKIKFPETLMTAWAEKYSYSRGEEPLISLRPTIRNKGYLSKSQLRLVAQWKSPRSAGHVEKNSEAFVKEITSFSLNTKDERARIEVLTLLDGVRWPSASVILHLFHEEPYPIVDYRALWSIGLPVPNQYSFIFWWPYVEYCRELAQRNSVSMRTLDRALWQFSKENQ